MTDDEKEWQAGLEAVNDMLGGFPSDFEQQTPQYQLAWLQQRVPQLQQEMWTRARLRPSTASVARSKRRYRNFS